MVLVMFRFTLSIWLFLIGKSISAPTDEFNSFIGGDLSMNDDGLLMGIVPGTQTTQGSQKHGNIYDFIENNGHLKTLNNLMRKGSIKRGLTFNIYNEDMKEAAINLFEVIHSAKAAGHNIEKLIDFEDINDDLITYVSHINMLYDEDTHIELNTLPMFINKPNFFVNSETIVKAIKLSNHINNIQNNSDEAIINQYYKTKDALVINTNYSGWNLPNNGGEDKLNYFREDISLNSYYYGVHLMHPFWMIGHKLLNTVNTKPNENYYFIHQQLIARLLLEKEHLRDINNLNNKHQFIEYDPYLVHDNGLPFPVRRPFNDRNEEVAKDRAQIKTIDIAIKECIDRGILIIENSDYKKMTENNYVSLITKLVRANFEAGRAAKIVRSLYGYGGSGYPYTEYNPAPSILHYPQTSLRDPMYWKLMQHVINYYTEYEKSIDPFNLQVYETKLFEIIDFDIPDIKTYFDYYQFDISRALSKTESVLRKMPLPIAARQKRIKHSKFELNFTVGSQESAPGIVRLFLGPSCADDCWDKYSRFFEIDKFKYHFQEGVNTVTWSPETSTRLSSDDSFNIEAPDSTTINLKYNMFKFPENLIIPRGVDKGLNFTIFIMVTPADNDEDLFMTAKNLYGEMFKDLDRKPLGFPFHRQATANGSKGINYKFYNITIYHKQNSEEKNSYFSPHLN